MPGNLKDSSDRLISRWVRGEPGELAPENRELLATLDRLIREEERQQVLDLVGLWDPLDIRDLLIFLPIKLARRLFNWLPSGIAVAVLVAVSPDLRAQLMQDIEVVRIAEIAEALAEDDAVELLDDLPQAIAEEVLDRLPDGEDLRERLQFEEDTAGEAMTTKFVAVVDHWNVRMATRAVRKMAAEIESFYEVYVVNEERQLVGRLQLRDLLLNKKKTRIRDIMRPIEVFVSTDEDQEDVLELERTYNVHNIPDVDDSMTVSNKQLLAHETELLRE